jgi:acyl carrier protein
MAVSPEQGFRWRFRGPQPTYEEFVRTMRDTVFIQFLIVSTDGARRLGVVVCYAADFRNRTAYIAVQAIPEVMSKGWVLNAGSLFINYLFSCYDFHKLYAESPEFVAESVRSGIGKGFVEEACFREHERFMGRAWDVFVFAYYRSTWEASGTRWQRLASSESVPEVTSSESGLSFEDFTLYLSRQLDLEESLIPSTRFQEDLGFDSIRMLELLCVIEDLGISLTDAAMESMVTIDDAFFQYLQQS